MVTYGNIKSPKKQGLEDTFLEKPQGRPPAFLGLRLDLPLSVRQTDLSIPKWTLKSPNSVVT